MRQRSRNWGHSPNGHVFVDAVILLAGGFGGAALLTLVHIPAGALIGAVLGSMSVNKMTELSRRRRVEPLPVCEARAAPAVSSRRLPAVVRIVGQVLLGVMAGARLDSQTLSLLAAALLPLLAAVITLLGITMALARYLFLRHGIDPVTAVMAAAPGGVSELAVAAQREGAVMHVVLAFHLFRVLLVVLVVLPLVVLAVRTW